MLFGCGAMTIQLLFRLPGRFHAAGCFHAEGTLLRLTLLPLLMLAKFDFIASARPH